jgi:hypothetical protein
MVDLQRLADQVAGRTTVADVAGEYDFSKLDLADLDELQRIAEKARVRR